MGWGWAREGMHFSQSKNALLLYLPELKSALDLSVDLVLGDPAAARVLADPVGQRLDAPPAALKRVTLSALGEVARRPQRVLDAAPRRVHQLHRLTVELTGGLKSGKHLV